MSGDGKRERRNHGGQKRNPRRGGPAMLLTCETGREVKCKREGLDILRHYHKNQATKTKSNNDAKELTLEEEIGMLQQGASSEQILAEDTSSTFTVFETGCRGTVFIMCTLPNSALIPSIRPFKRKAGADNNDGAARETTSDDEQQVAKKPRVEENDESVAAEGKEVPRIESPLPQEPDPPHGAQSTTGLAAENPPPWDPLDTVQRVMKDLDAGCTTTPSSRFVTRMIPIQATCFASTEEIQLTARALIAEFLADKTPSTFGVVVKRRNCAGVTRTQVIDALAGELLGGKSNWKVDLKAPKFTFLVEICKTLCGMSIIENFEKYRKFNLVEIREAEQNLKDES